MSSDCPRNLLFRIFLICKIATDRTASLCGVVYWGILSRAPDSLAHSGVTQCESKWNFKSNSCSSVMTSFPWLSLKIISLLHLPPFLPVVGTQVTFSALHCLHDPNPNLWDLCHSSRHLRFSWGAEPQLFVTC